MAEPKIEYPFEAPTPDGAVVEVAPGILWARIPMPIGLDHINVYLLRDGDGWTIVDTGLNTGKARELWGALVERHLEGRPVRRLLCTHFHYDHAGLAAWWVEEHGVTLLMSHGEYFQMRGLSAPPPDPLPVTQRVFYERAGLSAEATEAMFAALRKDPFMPPVPPSYQRLRHGDRLRIGEREWQVVVGEGHSPEHICLYHPEDRILIAGDQLLPRITSNVAVTPIEPEGNPLGLWLASLDRLDQLAPQTLVLPSHQRVFRGLHARVQELRQHHDRQFDLLYEAIVARGAATAFELRQVQFPNLKHAYDEMMALGETIAHLSWLRHEGRVRRELDDDGCYRFRPAA